MFIRKTEVQTDIELVKKDLNHILTLTTWEPYNQIGLTHRPGAVNKWHDSTGHLRDKNTIDSKVSEDDFIVLNDLIPDYLRSQLLTLKEKEKINLGRIRFMRLKTKTGLSIHYDGETRYHLVIETNPYALIGKYESSLNNEISDVQCTGATYHLPVDNHWYHVDTTKHHYVYNGGLSDRIHLVACVI